MHLGIRPESVDMSKVERWNYVTHLTNNKAEYLTLIKLESGAYKSEGNVCRKKQLRLFAPSWKMPSKELIRSPEWRQDSLYAAPVLKEGASCDTVSHWTEFAPSIVQPDQFFDLFEQSQDWIANVSQIDFCSATNLGQSDYCFNLHQRLQSGIKTANLIFVKLYDVAQGNNADVSVEFQFRMEKRSPLFDFYIHAQNDETLFERVTISEIVH
ncbi:hypothetical protein [Kordiimonas laminariae]|uniref:hypothetical protein n=1 Tax=Kordiimonas laminariae TaxID=2917717 RepID=UPI001FF2C263|nr:hypothetical protein [Kordiimonas laminariae]MCK0070569.1 hypothetical protein [Kordiimonas laminariae]